MLSAGDDRVQTTLWLVTLSPGKSDVSNLGSGLGDESWNKLPQEDDLSPFLAPINRERMIPDDTCQQLMHV